jgi:glycogen debranching enzyme
LFGRDTLISSLQSLCFHAGFARAALDALGALQATECDDYRDAQPGKILHELRLGELATLKLIPHTPYYGTADATPLYLFTLHATWRCTGKSELLERHLGRAEGCLEWIDRDGDLDHDGFQEYISRSRDGLTNQGWKDSSEALVYPDGTLVKPPIALCGSRAMSMTLGYAWPRSTISSIGETARPGYVKKLMNYTCVSTKLFGTNKLASTPSHSTPKSGE